MALDCPVITADVPGAREQYGDAALFFHPTDERDLAKQIHSLVVDVDLRNAQIERGRKRAGAWTAEHYVREVLSIIDEFRLIARAWERCDSEIT
jgi:glycosyltransferase involved in cell wall biosynthesis